MADIVADLLQRTWKIIDAEADAFAEGKTVDMSALEAQARYLCDTIAKLPEGQGALYQKDLEELILCLTRFADQLQARKDKIEQQVQALNTQMSAHKLYQKTAMSSSAKKQEE